MNSHFRHHVMRSPLTIALLASLLASPLIGQTDKTLQSKIVSAIVFNDRALVTRSATGDFSPGKYNVKVAGLPLLLNDQSVRISGTGTAKAKIMEVRVEVTLLDSVPDARVKDLQNKLKAVQDELRKLNDRGGDLSKQRDFLGRISIASAENISKDLRVQRPSIDDWQRVLSFLDANNSRLNAEQRDLDAQKEQLQKKETEIQFDMREVTPSQQPREKRVFIALDVMSGGSLDLGVSYLVQNASWQPIYDLRAFTDQKKIELTYNAMVWQNTGEDWKDITLTLSTAQPLVGGNQPTLTPMYVDAVPPPAPPADFLRGGRAEEQGITVEAQRPLVTVSKTAGAQVISPDLVPLGFETAHIQSGATSTSFEVGAKATVLSNSTRRKVTIMAASLNGEFKYSSVPKLQPRAYFKSSVANSTDYLLLDGTMSVFVDNNYTGNSHLSTVMPGEKFDAFLGVDDGIKVERKILNKFTENTGFLSRSKKITYDILIKVENLKKTADSITIQDNVPISRNEKILVTVETPRPEELQPDAEGLLRWNMELKPGEKRDIHLKYSIEYPTDFTVSALE